MIIKEDFIDQTVIRVSHIKSRVCDFKSRGLQIEPRENTVSMEMNLKTCICSKIFMSILSTKPQEKDV